MASGQFVAHADLTFLGHIDLSHLENARRQLVADGDGELAALEFGIEQFVLADIVADERGDEPIGMLVFGPGIRLHAVVFKVLEIRGGELGALGDDLGVEHRRVPVDRGPGEEVFAREIDPHLLHSDPAGGLLREGIVQREVLEAEVRRILEEIVAVRVHRADAAAGHRHAVEAARPVRMVGGVGNRPVGGALVQDHPVELVVKGEVVGPFIAAPEQGRALRRIPVAVTDTLQEHAQAQSVPLRVEVDAELVAGHDIADAVEVAVVLEGAGSGGDFLIAVDIDETDVTRKGDGGGAEVVVPVRVPVFGFLVGQEEPVRHEAPELAEFLAFVEAEDVVALVVEAGDPGAVVPEAALDGPGQVLAAQFEGIPPGEREFPAIGPELAVIALRRGRAEDGGEFRAGRVHIVGETDVIVAREGEAAPQEVHVEADVPGLDLFPGQAVRDDGGHACDVGITTVEDDRTLADAHRLEEGIRGNAAVAEGAPVPAQFQVVDHALGTLHPGLFRDPPARRCGREPAAALVARKAGIEVIADRSFEDIPPFQRVIGAGEGADGAPVAVIFLQVDLAAFEHLEAREAGIKHPEAEDGLDIVPVVFQVPPGHHVQFMVGDQPGGERPDHIGGQVVRRIMVFLFIGVGLAHIVGDDAGGKALRRRGDITLREPGGKLEGDVRAEFEHIFHGLEVDARRRNDGRGGGLLGGFALVEGRIAGSGAAEGVRPVRIGHRQHGKTDHRDLLDLAAHLVRALGEDGLDVVHAVEIGIVVDGEPVPEFEGDLRAEVVLVKHVGTDVHHAFLAVIGR